MQASNAIVNSCRHCTARCCRGLAVVLTIPEAKRLVAATGLEPGEILEFSSNINSKETPHYPLLAKLGNTVEEYYILIKRHRKVDCVFLNYDLRCTIYACRPYVCRLYPYDLDGKKVKKGALCPVKFEKEAGMERVSKKLEDDLVQHGLLAVRWSASHSGEIPSMKKFREYFGD